MHEPRRPLVQAPRLYVGYAGAPVEEAGVSPPSRRRSPRRSARGRSAYRLLPPGLAPSTLSRVEAPVKECVAVRTSLPALCGRGAMELSLVVDGVDLGLLRVLQLGDSLAVVT